LSFALSLQSQSHHRSPLARCPSNHRKSARWSRASCVQRRSPGSGKNRGLADIDLRRLQHSLCARSDGRNLGCLGKYSGPCNRSSKSLPSTAGRATLPLAQIFIGAKALDVVRPVSGTFPKGATSLNYAFSAARLILLGLSPCQPTDIVVRNVGRGLNAPRPSPSTRR